jgi:hypothetical protein
MCELYDCSAEIFVYDHAQGCRRLYTFHHSPSTQRPCIRLSYYGGAHYDSIVGADHSHAVLHTPPGEAEDRARLSGGALDPDADVALREALRASRDRYERIEQEWEGLEEALRLSLLEQQPQPPPKQTKGNDDHDDDDGKGDDGDDGEGDNDSDGDDDDGRGGRKAASTRKRRRALHGADRSHLRRAATGRAADIMRAAAEQDDDDDDDDDGDGAGNDDDDDYDSDDDSDDDDDGGRGSSSKRPAAAAAARRRKRARADDHGVRAAAPPLRWPS